MVSLCLSLMFQSILARNFKLWFRALKLSNDPGLYVQVLFGPVVVRNVCN